MCIISGDIESVTNTNILVAPLHGGKKQLTAYSNAVKISADPVAMILPFPKSKTGGGESLACEMVDISAYKDVFDDIKMYFLTHGFRSRGAKMFVEPNAAASALAVHRCGSYQYSIVPTIADFNRVSSTTFKLDPNVANLLKKDYSDFSFLVCIIDESAPYSPIAYVHDFDGTLFIPTKHYHSHPHPESSTASATESADWDHTIYVIGSADLGKTIHGVEPGNDDNMINLDKIFRSNHREVILNLLPLACPYNRIRKLRIEGSAFPNKDLTASVY